MPSIPHTVILESVLKNITGQINYADLCDQLNPTELLKYVTTVHSLSDILKQYGTATIYQSSNEVRMVQKHNVPLFKNVVRELFSVISPNPSDMSMLTNNLSVVQIGEYVVKRFGGSLDMDVLLDILFNRVSVNRHLQHVPKNICISSVTIACEAVSAQLLNAYCKEMQKQL